LKEHLVVGVQPKPGAELLDLLLVGKTGGDDDHAERADLLGKDLVLVFLRLVDRDRPYFLVPRFVGLASGGARGAERAAPSTSLDEFGDVGPTVPRATEQGR